MAFHIDAVRYGFACNSSSTHSCVVLDDPDITTDEMSNFQWDYFTVAPKDFKRYLLATALSQFPEHNIDRTQDWVISHVSDILHILDLKDEGLDEVDLLNRAGHYDFSVDHQSLIRLPRQYEDDRKLDLMYLSQLYDWATKNSVGVLGGNDNDDTGHHLEGKAISFPGLIDTSRGYVCRQDGSRWVLFNRTNGHRHRVRFDDTAPSTRASFAELVDICLTSYCGYGCSFCYQGSTKSGKHGDTQTIKQYISKLAYHRCFEVALGGGEPTTHPDFKEICEHARSNGVIPNFTTRNIEFVRDNYKWCAETTGAIAFSAEYDKTIHQVAALRQLHSSYYDYPHFTVQIVCGVPYGGVGSLMDLCKDKSIPVTLLGFKEQHRGKTTRQNNYDDWVAAARRIKRFNVDTAFLAKHIDQLNELVGEDNGVKYFSPVEGVESCYLDAVTNQLAPSSYCDQSRYISVSPSTILEAWRNLVPHDPSAKRD
jgi:organic radical activating enzyme